MTTFNFIKKNFTLLVIALLVIIILLQRSCNGNSNQINKPEIIKIEGKSYEVIKRITDTLIVPTVQTVYKAGSTIYKDRTIYVEIPTRIDTTQIINEYLSINVYKDTLLLQDSLGYISVIDSISKNLLTGRVWDAHVNKTTINNTIYLKTLPKNQLYLGGMISYARPAEVLIGTNLILKTKTDKMYTIGYSVSSDVNSYFHIGIAWKLSLKK